MRSWAPAAPSTPVGPPPTKTKVKSPSSCLPRNHWASSKRSIIVLRTCRASRSPLNAWCELHGEDLSGRYPHIRVGLPTSPEGKGADSTCSMWTPSSPYSTSFVDDLCQPHASEQRRPGPLASLSESEVIALSIFAYFESCPLPGMHSPPSATSQHFSHDSVKSRGGSTRGGVSPQSDLVSGTRQRKQCKSREVKKCSTRRPQRGLSFPRVVLIGMHPCRACPASHPSRLLGSVLGHTAQWTGRPVPIRRAPTGGRQTTEAAL